MHIALVGMSNVGKSSWAKRLAAEAGFDLIECDRLIAARLAPQLKWSSTKAMAEWMGQPFEPGYRDAAGAYLDHEKAVMQDVLKKLGSAVNPVVVDTTGSVIYTGGDILEKLRKQTRVVYFEIPLAGTAKFFERYMKEPKPVIWGDLYVPRKDETPQDALRRCYPLLLESRITKYAAIAHVTVPFEWQQKADTKAFLDYIGFTKR